MSLSGFTNASTYENCFPWMRLKAGANPSQVPQHLQRKGEVIHPCGANGKKELLRSCDPEKLRHVIVASNAEELFHLYTEEKARQWLLM